MIIIYRIASFILGVVAIIGSSLIGFTSILGNSAEAVISEVTKNTVNVTNSGRQVYEKTKQGYWKPKEETQYTYKYSFSVGKATYKGSLIEDQNIYRTGGKLKINYLPFYPDIHNSYSPFKACLIMGICWLLGIILIASAIQGNYAGIYIGGKSRWSVNPVMPSNVAYNQNSPQPQIAPQPQMLNPSVYAFCPKCGVKLGAVFGFCPMCGVQLGQSQSLGIVQHNMVAVHSYIGFSNAVNDTRFTAKAKKHRAIAYGCAVLIIPMPFIGFVAYSFISDDMQIGEAVMTGAGVSAIFFVFYLFYFVYKAMQSPWEGVVVEKFAEQRYRNANGVSETVDYYTALVLKVRTNSGKIKELEFREYNDYFFRNFDIGERIKYHPQLEYYEKYDKSHEASIRCPLCAKDNPIENDLCVCGAPIIK